MLRTPSVKFSKHNLANTVVFTSQIESNRLSIRVSIRLLNPPVPDAPNWRNSDFEKGLRETERS